MTPERAELNPMLHANRYAAVAPALLLTVSLLVACGGSTQRVPPTVGHVPPSKYEREFFAKFHTTAAEASPAHGVTAGLLSKRLRTVAVAQHAEVVSLRVYRLASDARLTPVETVAVSQPAPFLRDSIDKILRALNPEPYYLRVLDAEGRDVLDIWTTGHGRSGYTVQLKYRGCNPLTEDGLGGPPPCPKH